MFKTRLYLLSPVQGKLKYFIVCTGVSTYPQKHLPLLFFCEALCQTCKLSKPPFFGNPPPPPYILIFRDPPPKIGFFREPFKNRNLFKLSLRFENLVIGSKQVGGAHYVLRLFLVESRAGSRVQQSESKFDHYFILFYHHNSWSP